MVLDTTAMLDRVSIIKERFEPPVCHGVLLNFKLLVMVVF